MAIAFNHSADLGNATTTAFTASYTLGSGSNLLILAIIGDFQTATGGGGHDDITGVTYGGTTCLLATKEIDNSGVVMDAPRYTYLYYLLSPPTGANTVAINCTNSHFIAAVAADYTGAAVTGQPDGTATSFNDNATFTSFSVSGTSHASNCWAIAASAEFATGNLQPTAGSGTTLRIAGSAFGEPGIWDSGVGLGVGSWTLNANMANPETQGYAFAAATFVPATNVHTLPFLGAGSLAAAYAVRRIIQNPKISRRGFIKGWSE